MPKFDPNKPRRTVTFQCTNRYCKWTESAEPEQVIDAPEYAPHPFRYVITCPVCKEPVEQAAWERSLQKAWLNATGPRTEEGKAATAANLEGHPTPEETKRTRFNAMKSGIYARTANYFPAKPDGYARCSTCEVEREWCAQQPACVKQTEIFMLHQAAFDQKDPKVLGALYADLQSAVFAVIQQILQTIIADGVKLQVPRFTSETKDDTGTKVWTAEVTDQHGKKHTIYDVEAHPLFRPLGELISRTGLSLGDMGMTAKVLEMKDDDELGNLDKSKQEPPDEYRKRSLAALEAMQGKMDRARDSTARDPVLIEHNAESGDGSQAE